MSLAPELESSAISLTGPVREENQDAVRIPDANHPPEMGQLYGLADGIGGYAHGALASQLALDALFETFYTQRAASTKAALRRGVENANLKVFKTSQQLNAGRMGTTLTAVHIHQNRLQLAHVGDCRLYLVRNHTAACLTNDHTLVGDLVRMHVLTPDRVRTHFQRSVLTRGVGLTMFITPDVSEVRLQDGDCLVMCSDGVWSMIEDEEIARMASEGGSAASLGQRLVDLTLSRNADDNVSVVAIYVRHLASEASTVSETGAFPPERTNLSFVHTLRSFLPNKINSILGRDENGNHRQP